MKEIELIERLVIAFESIAESQESIADSAKRSAKISEKMLTNQTQQLATTAALEKALTQATLSS